MGLRTRGTGSKAASRVSTKQETIVTKRFSSMKNLARTDKSGVDKSIYLARVSGFLHEAGQDTLFVPVEDKKKSESRRSKQTIEYLAMVSLR